MKKFFLSLATLLLFLGGALGVPATASAQVRPITEQRKTSQLTIASQALIETSANYVKYIKYLTVPPERQVDPDFHSNNPAVVRKLEDNLRRQMFNAMSNNRDRFDFPTLADAQENFLMRVSMIDFMVKIGQGPTSGVDFDYHTPQTPAEADTIGWTKIGKFRFRTREGVRPADAIDGMVSQRFRGECLGALEVTLLQAARRTIGADRFNQLHRAGLQVPGREVHKHTRTGPLTVRDMVPGDWVYLKNKDDYGKAAEKGGFWSGENAVYMGRYGATGRTVRPQYDAGQEPRFSGMGLYNMTESELRRQLKDHYLSDMRKFGVELNPRIEDQDVRWTNVARPETGSRAPAVPQNLVNTTWVGSENLEGYGRVEFRFQDNGQVTMVDKQATRPGAFTRTGNTVTLTFPGTQPMVYTGILSGSGLHGTAKAGATTWTFSVTR